MSLKKILFSAVALVLCLTMCLSLAACGESGTKWEKKTETRVVNDTTTLILQESTFDGVFSPFFYSSAYDGDVVGMVNVGLLTVDPTGAVVAGYQYDTVAQSYSVYYTSDLANYTPKDNYEDGDYVVYEMVLKNGAKFSDGTAISADDVLFNYYVYLDPAYVGSSTLYTLPILGLTDYRTQVANSDTYGAIADKIFAAGETYKASSDYTEEQFNAYWNGMKAAGEAFAQEIVDYVKANYGGLPYAQGGDYAAYSGDGIDFSIDGEAVAFGMAMWGFGEFAADNTFADIAGKTYDMTSTYPTVGDYWNALKAGYTDNGVVDFAKLSDTESAGMDLISAASENFILSYSNVGSIPSITGLVKGTTKVDGEDHETVKIILTEQNPKAILSLGVTVAPKAYYTAGYTPTSGALVNYGVELGINGNSKFMDHLQTLNAAPMGAGTYKFVKADGDGVTLERNEMHETMGDGSVYNANIKNVYLKVVESGKEFDALKAGDVHYATVSASADVVKEIATIEKLTSILVDNLGYGYICLNPTCTGYGLDNIYTRIAYTTVFDLAQVNNYYPNGLADVIYRSQSQVSWAYPEGATAIYPFDETLNSAIENFKKAGYTFDEASKKFTDVPDMDFYLPSNTEDHPAGGIFLRAQQLLATIGITANIKVDNSLIANIKAGDVPCYALAWQSSQDPDMYQVYHYQSAAESVISNGIKWLQANGNKTEKGTIEVTKLDGSKVTMTQTDALNYLAELIEQGTKYMSAEERKPIYEKALEVLAQLSIEIPTYQRKNMFGYDNSVISATTLSTTITPYWGPIAQIWKVSFADNVPGNTPVEVTYEAVVQD